MSSRSRLSSRRKGKERSTSQSVRIGDRGILCCAVAVEVELWCKGRRKGRVCGSHRLRGAVCPIGTDRWICAEIR